METTPVPTVPVPTPTPLPGHPRITVVQNPVLAGANFTIKGSGFTQGSEVNFFVSTPTGAINEGPLKIPGLQHHHAISGAGAFHYHAGSGLRVRRGGQHRRGFRPVQSRLCPVAGFGGGGIAQHHRD